MSDLRLPPFSIEAEQCVLGGLMLDNSMWDDIGLVEDDFYSRDHRLIFGAMSGLAAQGQPLDAVTVADSSDDIDLTYLAALIDETPGTSNLLAYADIVRERSLLRKLITRAGDIADDAYGGGDVTDIIDRAQRLLGELSDVGSSGPCQVASVIGPFLSALDAHQQRGGGMIGIPSGFPDLDNRLSGLCPGDLIIVAGRPSMGKSAWAFQVAGYVAQTRPVALFSLEMPAKQVLGRMVSQLGRIDYGKLRSAQLSDDEWSKVTKTTAALKSSKLYLDDSSGLSVNDIRARSRKLQRAEPLGLIVIDYLQLMATAKGERHDLDIGDITRALKALAKELECPVMLLSQLNRALEQRGDKRPRMSDLRESGSIEQDADVIIFPFRQEVYEEDDASVKGIAEIIVGKHRNGPIGTDLMAWLANFQRFEPLDEHSTRRYRARKRQSRGFEAA